MRGKIVAIVLALVAGAARADTIGLHLGSYHPQHPADRPRYNDLNLGAYYRADDGWQVGAYFNSIRRPSVYAGWTWSHDVGAVSVGLLAGLVTGYRAGPILPFAAPSVAVGAWRLSFVPATRFGASVFHLSYEWSAR